MMAKRPIGYQFTQTFCYACAPEGLQDFHEPMREGDDYGVPFHCDMCDEKLTPENWENGEPH